MLKRLFDCGAALLGLLLLAPLLLLLALLVRLDSPGPALYRSARVGRGGRPFTILKFRTMRYGSAGSAITAAADPRITRAGRWLRRTRLDELPQLLNVLRGDMSLVGPRPEIPAYVARYTPEQRAVLRVRPGIASPAALAFRHEELLLPPGDPDDRYGREVMPAKLAIDLEYLGRASLGLDIALLARTGALLLRDTLPALASGPGPRLAQRAAAMLLDAALVAVAVAAALELRYSGQVPAVEFERLRLTLPPLIALFLACNTLAGVYRRLWRYATAADVLAIGEAAAAATLLALAADVAGWTVRPLPASVALMAGVLTLLGSTALRYRWRLFTGAQWRYNAWRRRRRQQPATRVLIVGAGPSGLQAADYLCAPHQRGTFQVMGFVDDDAAKQGMLLHGVSVLGGNDSIPQLVERLRVELVVVALQRPDNAALRDLLALCRGTEAAIRVLHNPLDALHAPPAPAIDQLPPSELLGREAASIDRPACDALLRGKRVLVTGAAGSIGGELCRQILAFGPARLLLLDTNETGLYELRAELGAADPRLRLLVASIVSEGRLEQIFARERPEIVFHAAAYKHVPLLEEHPQEAVVTNVLGTLALQAAAQRHGVERFVLISSDKAVNPTSVLGASKRLGELLVASAPREHATRCAAVRFGNVLGSRGSVVPTFWRQIERGGPVTITDARMRRYFMSVQEAVSLVIHAAVLMDGGEVFMLEMGEPIPIVELAERLIRLRGLRAGADVPICYTGVRPGEKLHEELRAPHERPCTTPYNGICRLQSELTPERAQLLLALAPLRRAGVCDADEARALLFEALAAAEPFSQPSLYGHKDTEHTTRMASAATASLP